MFCQCGTSALLGVRARPTLLAEAPRMCPLLHRLFCHGTSCASELHCPRAARQSNHGTGCRGLENTFSGQVNNYSPDVASGLSGSLGATGMTPAQAGLHGNPTSPFEYRSGFMGKSTSILSRERPSTFKHGIHLGGRRQPGKLQRRRDARRGTLNAHER